LIGADGLFGRSVLPDPEDGRGTTFSTKVTRSLQFGPRTSLKEIFQVLERLKQVMQALRHVSSFPPSTLGAFSLSNFLAFLHAVRLVDPEPDPATTLEEFSSRGVVDDELVPDLSAGDACRDLREPWSCLASWVVLLSLFSNFETLLVRSLTMDDIREIDSGRSLLRLLPELPS